MDRSDPIASHLRYTYDADGRLIERRRFSWVSGAWSLAETTRYLNDGLQCVAEFNASNTLLRRQVWGLDLDGSRGGLGGIGGLLWIVSTANGTHYAAPDGSGNVVALFGTSGAETARYEYGPFGELLRMSGTAIAAENPWRFSSKRQDPTTDWVHYEFRVYDPSSGRWLSRDPIGEAGGENLYGFVGNDPVNRVDLFGFCATCVAEESAEPGGLSCGIPGPFRHSISNWVDQGMDWAQNQIDQLESPVGGYIAQLGLELGGIAVNSMPAVAGERMGIAAQKAYCEGGILGVAKSAYAGLEEMVGTADLVRAFDYEDQYTAGERIWFAVQGGAKSLLAGRALFQAQVGGSTQASATGAGSRARALDAIAKNRAAPTAPPVAPQCSAAMSGQFSTIAGEGMNAGLFSRMKTAFERQGGRILQGGDVEAYLRRADVEGSTARGNGVRSVHLTIDPGEPQ